MTALVRGAFEYQGQKCSALSRLIVVDPQGESGPAIRHVIDRVVDLGGHDPVAGGIFQSQIHHRAIDGADGAQLMEAIKQLVENPMGLVV